MAKTIVHNASVIFRPTNTAVRYLRCRIGVAAQPHTYHYYIVERDVFVSENEVAAAGPPDERMRSRDTTAPLNRTRRPRDDDIGTVIIRSPVGGRRFSMSVLWSGFYYFFFLFHLPQYHLTYADVVCTGIIIIL